MKLKRYLTESANMNYKALRTIEDVEATKQEIIETLEKNCKPFISKMGKSRLLLRGSRVSNSDGIIKLSPRSDRKPMSTNPGVHKIIDEVFQSEFGWKPRSTGLFCTTVFNTALFYGQPNSIWPIGPFKFLWSKTITDFFTWLSDVSTKEYSQLIKGSTSGEASDITKVKEILKKAVDQYTDKNLSKALNSNSEIMIGCKNYYMVSNTFRVDLQKHFKLGPAL